jgi:arsenite oxidase large subunit
LLFGYIRGVHGDVVTSWVDRNVVPYFKDTWASVKRVGSVDDYKATIFFKDRRYARPVAITGISAPDPSKRSPNK